jgi:glycosyltransferase 2 family protein
LKSYLQNLVKILLSFSFGLFLLYWVLRLVNFQQIEDRFYKANYIYVFIFMALYVLGCLIRAYRWNMLLNSLGTTVKLYPSFLTILSAYVINLVAPRAGELARCILLERMTKVSTVTSLATLVLERIIDLLILFLILGIALLVEYKKIYSHLLEGTIQKFPVDWSISIMLLVVVFLLTFLLVRVLKKYYDKLPLGKKLKDLISKFYDGLLTISKVRNKLLFIFLSVFIWFIYYLSAYVLFFSFEETSFLSPWDAFVILLMGALGMAAPIQGGIGTYHLFVGNTLASYGMKLETGYVIATFWHTIQLLITVFTGILALMNIFWINQHKNEKI